MSADPATLPSPYEPDAYGDLPPAPPAPADGGSPFRARDRRSKLLTAGLSGGLALLVTGIWVSPQLPGPAGDLGRHIVESVPGVTHRQPTAEEQLRLQLAATKAELGRQKRALAAAQARLVATPHPTSTSPAVDQVTLRHNASATTSPTPSGTSSPRPTVTVTVTRRPTTATPPPKVATYCDDFRWQQDAQAALAAKPALAATLDPNGDGYACRGYLAVDPRRAATPLPKAPLPQTPTAAALEQSPERFFGVFTPTRVGEVDEVTRATGTAPTLWGYFGGWGSWTTAEDGTKTFAPEAFDGSKVVSSWQRGVLPMLTWEPRPLAGGPDPYFQDFTLAKIAEGDYDAYITQYATSVRDLGLPLAIRFAHEMNGDWYPWAERTNGGSAGQYVAAWRHVHDLFDAAGAGDLVVWVWAPNRIDALPAAGRDLARFYPGDAYVDWVGMSGYLRPTAVASRATFDGTFATTLAALRTTAPGKPILLAEIGATESLLDASRTSTKPGWITSVFSALADPANADVVGLVWFDMAKTALVEGVPQTNDWRIDSTTASLTAFSRGIAADALHLREPYRAQ